MNAERTEEVCEDMWYDDSSVHYLSSANPVADRGQFAGRGGKENYDTCRDAKVAVLYNHFIMSNLMWMRS